MKMNESINNSDIVKTDATKTPWDLLISWKKEAVRATLTANESVLNVIELEAKLDAWITKYSEMHPNGQRFSNFDAYFAVNWMDDTAWNNNDCSWVIFLWQVKQEGLSNEMFEEMLKQLVSADARKQAHMLYMIDLCNTYLIRDNLIANQQIIKDRDIADLTFSSLDMTHNYLSALAKIFDFFEKRPEVMEELTNELLEKSWEYTTWDRLFQIIKIRQLLEDVKWKWDLWRRIWELKKSLDTEIRSIEKWNITLIDLFLLI